VVHYASLEDQFKGPVQRGKRELEKSARPTKKNTNFMWGIKFDKMTLGFVVWGCSLKVWCFRRCRGGAEEKKKKFTSGGVVIFSQGLPCAPQGSSKLAQRVTGKRAKELSPAKIVPKAIKPRGWALMSQPLSLISRFVLFFSFGKREL